MCLRGFVSANENQDKEGIGYKIVHKTGRYSYRNYWGEFRRESNGQSVGRSCDEPGRDSVHYRKNVEHTVTHDTTSASDGGQTYLAGVHIWKTLNAVRDDFPLMHSEDAVLVEVKWRHQIVANASTVVAKHMTIVKQLTRKGFTQNKLMAVIRNLETGGILCK